MTTAEDVKRVLREYAADHFPGRGVVAIGTFRIEDEDEFEQLVTTAGPSSRPGPPSPTVLPVRPAQASA